MSSNRKAFLDFYNSGNIIPVNQSNYKTKQFLAKREFLYSQLGLPLYFLRNSDVLEVGAGGGYNAVATARYGLDSMTLVDGSRAGFALLEKRSVERAFNARRLKLIHEDFTQLRLDKEFDVCICEGTIPGQNEPQRFVRKVASNVRLGGYLIITCTTPSSVLSEIFRRVLYPAILHVHEEKSLRICESLFLRHLRTLSVKTRSVKDWVQDSIVHPWERGRYVYGVSDAVKHLGNTFEFVHALPSISRELGWYKGYVGPRKRNEAVRKEWERYDIDLLDRRVLAVTPVGSAYKHYCLELLALHDDVRTTYTTKRLQQFSVTATRFGNSLGAEFSVTKRAISEFNALLNAILRKGRFPVASTFAGWWGRAQIYASFRKVA